MCIITCNLYDCNHHERVVALCPPQRQKRLRLYNMRLQQFQLQEQQQQQQPQKPRGFWKSLFSSKPKPLPRPLLRPATSWSYTDAEPPKIATQHCCRHSLIQKRTTRYPSDCVNCEYAQKLARRAQMTQTTQTTQTPQPTHFHTSRRQQQQPTPSHVIRRQPRPQTPQTPPQTVTVQMHPIPSQRDSPPLRREKRRLPDIAPDKPLPPLPPPSLSRVPPRLPPQPTRSQQPRSQPPSSSRTRHQSAALSPALVSQAFALAPQSDFDAMYQSTPSSTTPWWPTNHQQQQQQQQTQQRQTQRPRQSRRRHLPPPPLQSIITRREPQPGTPSPCSSTGSAWIQRPVSPLNSTPGAYHARCVRPLEPWLRVV